jgi:hypothetical protein
MRIGFVVLLCLLGSLAPRAHAQGEAPRDCKIFDGRQWQGLGTVTRTECLEGIEQWVGEYNAQGFKFGLWGSMMLSADRNYFYRSPDGGKNWEALGLKSELTVRVAEPPEPQAQAEAEAAAAVEPAEQTEAPAPGYDDSWAAAAPVEIPEPTAAPTPTPAPSSASSAPVQPPVAGFDRRSCSLGVSAAWEQIGILTLRECAQALDRSPDNYDELGFKYGYWNGVFLAASAREILSSTDSRSWQPLLPRTGR